MVAILTSDEMQVAERATFDSSALPSRAVMEVAGRVVAGTVLEYEKVAPQSSLILCGPGNNGGDGYVVARSFLQRGYSVRVVACGKQSEAGDAASAAAAFLAAGGIIESYEASMLDSLIETFLEVDVCIDALFGTGLSRPLDEPYASLITALNTARAQCDTRICAIDTPSGLIASSGVVSDPARVLKADYTIALQTVKVAHVSLPAREFCGDVFCADIGVRVVGNSRHLDTSRSIRQLAREYLTIPNDAHKGVRGRVVVLGGSPSYFGAPQLSAQAALVSGAGLVSMVLPEAAARVIGPKAGALICRSLPSTESGDWLPVEASEVGPFLVDADALVVGPGMGLGEASVALLQAVLREAASKDTPVVVDADALSILAGASSLEMPLGKHALLTPHPGEMARLLGCTTAEVQADRFLSATTLSVRLKSWVLLKGAYSVLASPQGMLWVSPFATPALATAGSGDILAGCLAGIACRNSDWQISARIAMHAHGLTGAAIEIGPEGVFGGNAEGILRVLPRTLRALQHDELPPEFLVERVLPEQIPGKLVQDSPSTTV